MKNFYNKERLDKARYSDVSSLPFIQLVSPIILTQPNITFFAWSGRISFAKTKKDMVCRSLVE